MKKKITLMILMTGVSLALLLTASWLTQGCSGKIPSVPAMVPTVLTYTPTP